MIFGAQVSQRGGLLAALARAEQRGAEVLQVFAQSPRQWKPPNHDDGVLETFRLAVEASATVKQTFCHAPYLINLANPDPVVSRRSRQCLADNLAAATAMGTQGLIVHVGSHLGAGLEAGLDVIAAAITAALCEVADGRLILENTAGAGGTIGRTFEELAAIVDRVASERIAICLDTQHLWASGVSFRTKAEADRVVRTFDRAIGLDRLACLHLNDSTVPFGANRDRHANLGEGTVPEDAFRALLGHPKLQRLPAILEIPGFAGDSAAAEDLAVARRWHNEGLALRAAR